MEQRNGEGEPIQPHQPELNEEKEKVQRSHHLSPLMGGNLGVRINRCTLWPLATPIGPVYSVCFHRIGNPWIASK